MSYHWKPLCPLWGLPPLIKKWCHTIPIRLLTDFGLQSVRKLSKIVLYAPLGKTPYDHPVSSLNEWSSGMLQPNHHRTHESLRYRTLTRLGSIRTTVHVLKRRPSTSHDSDNPFSLLLFHEPSEPSSLVICTALQTDAKSGTLPRHFATTFSPVNPSDCTAPTINW